MKYAKFALFAWYFAAQIPYEDPIIITALVGPFANRLACEAALDEAMPMLDMFGASIKPCFEVEDV